MTACKDEFMSIESSKQTFWLVPNVTNAKERVPRYPQHCNVLPKPICLKKTLFPHPLMVTRCTGDDFVQFWSRDPEIIILIYCKFWDSESRDSEVIILFILEVSLKKNHKLYEIEHQRNISEAEKEKNHEYLRNVVRILNDKEKHSPHDCDDLDNYGIRDIETLFDEANEEEYYKPIFVKSFHKGNFKYYERDIEKRHGNGDIEKRLSVKQYLNKITPYLYVFI